MLEASMRHTARGRPPGPDVVTLRGLLLDLQRLQKEQGGNEVTMPSINAIAERSMRNWSVVDRGLRALEKSGDISITRYPGGGLSIHLT
jgi:hypothetical protein